MRKRLSILALALFLLLSACGPSGGTSAAPDAGDTADSAPSAGTDLTVYGFDAGKADAFLLTTENSAVLIDCGEKGFGKTILSYLEAQGITKLDYLIITHFDQDHVGGAARILNRFPVGTVLQTAGSKDSEEYEKYTKALLNASIEPVTVQETYSFILDGVQYSVDPPRKAKYADDTSNNVSLIVSVVNGENSLLFTGDARTERLQEFLSYNARTYDVLKIPHHGKEEPLLGDLLESVSPAYAVITSSAEEPEDSAVTDLLAQTGVETYLTRNGPVSVTSDGTSVQVRYADVE